MLIRSAELWQSGIADLRIADGIIAQIGQLVAHVGEEVIEAKGGALLPGLHDHHLHLAALAVSRSSVSCGPPGVVNETELGIALARPGKGWLRGTGYNESVAGMLYAGQLDRLVPGRPVRIQHRTGRMWFLNSMAIDILLAMSAPPEGLECADGRWTGRLFDADTWLRKTLGSTPPAFGEISHTLAAMGLTGITDLSPANDVATVAHFAREQQLGHLVQRTVLGGTLSLQDGVFDPMLRLGPAKLHLHEADLPDFDETVAFVAAAHDSGRPVATHCVTETELVFALAALEAAGTIGGDRIEHASIAPDALVANMVRLQLQVVSQPHFIAERGDHYLREVAQRDQPYLYRLASLQRAGLTLAGSSDAPFGNCDPWAAMRAAVSRQTTDGATIGSVEALPPEDAVALYLGCPVNLMQERRLACGSGADLCLLDRPWREARGRLDAGDVRATIVAGSIVYDRVDQAPVERRSRIYSVT